MAFVVMNKVIVYPTSDQNTAALIYLFYLCNVLYVLQITSGNFQSVPYITVTIRTGAFSQLIVRRVNCTVYSKIIHLR